MFLDDIVGRMSMEEAKATKQRLDAKCWKGKHKEGTKVKGGVRVNNCVANEDADPANDNFTADDLKSLERIRDLPTLKARAKELIKGKPVKRMKPEKIAFFYDRVDQLNNPIAIIKMLYDMLLAGEGHKVIGSKSSMNPNSYRARFGEDAWHNGTNAWTSEHDQWTKESADVIPALTGVGESRLNVGDPVIVTAPNEFEGKTGEISEFSPSGKFVVVDLYNHGQHSMHLSDVEYNQYAADQEDEDDWYDDGAEDTLEGFQDFNKVEPYAVCLAGKPVKRFDYYEQARRFHDNWKQKLYNQGDRAKADTITLMPLNLDEGSIGDEIKHSIKGIKRKIANKPSRQDVKDKYWGKSLTARSAGDNAEADKNAHRYATVHNNTNSGKVNEQGVEEAISKKDLLNKVTKDLNSDEFKNTPVDPSKSFTRGDHWQGAKPGDYGYTGYQGHGMPKDNPKKNKGVAEGSFAHDQLKGEINDLFKPVVLQIVKWARAEGMTAKDLAGTSSHFFLDALDPDTYDRTQHLPDNYFNKLMDKANAKAVEILKKKGVAEADETSWTANSAQFRKEEDMSWPVEITLEPNADINQGRGRQVKTMTVTGQSRDAAKKKLVDYFLKNGWTVTGIKFTGDLDEQGVAEGDVIPFKRPESKIKPEVRRVFIRHLLDQGYTNDEISRMNDEQFTKAYYGIKGKTKVKDVRPNWTDDLPDELDEQGVAESATAPIIVPKRRAKAKPEPKFDIPYSADDYVPPALAMASAEALDRIIADPSTKETTRELAKKVRAQKNKGVAEGTGQWIVKYWDKQPENTPAEDKFGSEEQARAFLADLPAHYVKALRQERSVAEVSDQTLQNYKDKAIPAFYDAVAKDNTKTANKRGQGISKASHKQASRAGGSYAVHEDVSRLAEAGVGMWGDKGHNAKSQATRDLERSRNEKKQAADRSRAEERDRAWWKSQSKQGKEIKEDWIDDDAAEPLARYFADLYYGDFSATEKVKLTAYIYQSIQDGKLSIDQLKADIDMLEKEKGLSEETQLAEATSREILLGLLDKFYADMKLPPRQGSHSGALDIKSPGTKVWTRGDGTRLRDPGYVKANRWADDKKQAEKAATNFWPWLLKQPGVKSIGQVSGQFGSSPMTDAVSYKGLYFSGGPYGTEFGSMSRVKNPKSVWRHKPFELEPKAEQGMAEGIVDTIRSKNYARLADRSADKRATALDNFDEPEHQKQTDIMKQRNLKSRLLNKKGVAEDVSRLSDEEYNTVARYAKSKYPAMVIGALGRNPDGSINVRMHDTKNLGIIKEFKVRFRDPEETDIDEAETDYSKRRQREKDVDAGKPVTKQRQPRMTDYQKKRAQDKRDMELGEGTNYWTRLQGERNTRLNKLVDELKESVNK